MVQRPSDIPITVGGAPTELTVVKKPEKEKFVIVPIKMDNTDLKITVEVDGVVVCGPLPLPADCSWMLTIDK